MKLLLRLSVPAVGFIPPHLERRLDRPVYGASRIELGELSAGSAAIRVAALHGAHRSS